MRRHKIPPGWLLGLTLAAVVLSFPLGTTLGKYVWDEEVTIIKLTVTPYSEPPVTDNSLTSVSDPAVPVPAEPPAELPPASQTTPEMTADQQEPTDTTVTDGPTQSITAEEAPVQEDCPQQQELLVPPEPVSQEPMA